MKSQEFCYWLQGYFELSNSTQLMPEQVNLIKKHLNMVFAHDIDKQYDNQETLNNIHNGNSATQFRC